MKSMLNQLKGGDLRSIGKSQEVVKAVFDNPKLFSSVFRLIQNTDPIVRMRSADVIEKVSAKYPQYLEPYKKVLINNIAQIPQQEVRWHTAQMFSYLALTTQEKNQVAKLLFSWLKTEKSNIIKVMSMQTLASLAKNSDKIKAKVLPIINNLSESGAPSLKSRSQRLLKELSLNK